MCVCVFVRERERRYKGERSCLVEIIILHDENILTGQVNIIDKQLFTSC